MTKTEKIVLKKLIMRLNEVTAPRWSTGDLQDWAKWSGKMKNTILTSTAVMEGLVSDENPEQEN
jgi:hypothetical protein